MTPDDHRHGTPAGRTAHQRDNEDVCRPRQDAFRAYENKRTRRDRTDYRLSGYSESDGLGAGTWVLDPKTMTRKWIGQTQAPRILEEESTPRLISCPVCRAQINESCRTKNGRRRADHADRLLRRACPCGDRAMSGGLYCPPCSDESKRRSWRESKRRARVAREEAA